MNDSSRIYDLWGRYEYQLLVGLVFLGFSAAFWYIMFHQNEAAIDGRWLVYVIVALGMITGVAIISLRRLVFLDLAHHQFTRTVRLFGFAIHGRSWSFSALRCIQAQHGAVEGGYYCYVGFVPLSGSPIWLRSFTNEPATGPSNEAFGFAQELANTTGLPYEVRLKGVG